MDTMAGAIVIALSFLAALFAGLVRSGVGAGLFPRAIFYPLIGIAVAVAGAAAAMVAAIKGATTTDEMSTVLASEVMQWPTGDDK
jgi:hypothetical protein